MGTVFQRSGKSKFSKIYDSYDLGWLFLALQLRLGDVPTRFIK